MGQRIVGIVLAGGASSRMGRDKAAIRVGETNLLGHTVNLLQGLTSEVAVSGRDPGPLGIDIPWFEDSIPGAGPMGGVIAALERFAAPCLCVSCDLPLLTADVLALLVWAREDHDPGTVMTTFHDAKTGYVESLVAIYEPEALPLLSIAAANGLYKLSAAIPPDKRQHVPYPMNAETMFLNINSPEDLVRFRKLESDRKQS